MLRLLSALFFYFCAMGRATFTKKESMKNRKSFTRASRAEPSTSHEVLIALKQRNLDVIEQSVIDRSTPGSPNYQKWMTFEEIGNLTRNDLAVTNTMEWLTKESDVKVTWMSQRKEYIKATAPIAVWEKLLNTRFYSWLDKHPSAFNKKPILRAEEYSIPSALEQHIEAIFYTSQTPPVIQKHVSHLPDFKKAGFQVDSSRSDEHKTVVTPDMNRVKAALASAKDAKLRNDDATDVITVDFLNAFYEITSNTGSSDVTQCVFEAGQSFSQNDLATFQNDYSLPVQAAVEYDGGNVEVCSFDTCGEGNLDIQYIMGVSQISISYWWLVSNEDAFLAFVTELADDSNPPFVNSMSYGSIEQDIPASVLSQFNTEAMKLSAIGVTVTVSSGDNGVANYGIKTCNTADASSGENCPCTANSGSSTSSWTGTGTWSGQGYFPSFPATSPYVTAVGATMGAAGYPPAAGTSEIGCESNIDQVQAGVITSGGGFSTYYAQPSWQTSLVSKWAGSLTTATTPLPGYNKNGRAIPDLAFLGVWYQVVIDGQLESVFGTSCSSPVAAAMISLINAARVANSLSTVGYINPTLWAAAGNSATYATTFNDVTSGFNNCGENNGTAYPCCTAGFYAQPGWDPMTGLGSIDYSRLASVLGV